MNDIEYPIHRWILFDSRADALAFMAEFGYGTLHNLIVERNAGLYDAFVFYCISDYALRRYRYSVEWLEFADGTLSPIAE